MGEEKIWQGINPYLWVHIAQSVNRRGQISVIAGRTICYEKPTGVRIGYSITAFTRWLTFGLPSNIIICLEGVYLS